MSKIFVIFALCYFGMRAVAEEAKSSNTKSGATVSKESGGGDSDKLDLKQLEDKYWAAKDSDFSVVQNRTYTKANRWFLSGSFGNLINDSFSTASMGQMNNYAAGYYFSERWGVEMARETGALSDGPTVNQLKSGNGVTPNYNKFLNYTSVNFMWVPMYAKMSVMEKAIWYFDLQFAAGLGSLNYQNQITTGAVSRGVVGFNVDVTANVFFHRNWAFRLDIKNKFSTEDLVYYNPAGHPSSDIGNQSQQDTTFLLGFTYFH